MADDVGDDRVFLVLAGPSRRRHLNAGQRAILLAIAYPDPTKLKRTGSSNLEDQVHSGRLSEARAICAWAPEWIAEILDAGGAFATAFAAADERRERAAQVKALMDRLG
jgi:hypothetical protein